MVVTVACLQIFIFSQCSASIILFLVFHFIKIFLIFIHFLEMPHSLKLRYLVRQSSIFPVVFLILHFFIFVLHLQSSSLFNLMHQLTFIHILLVQLPSPLFQSVLPSPSFTFLYRMLDMLILQCISYGVWTYIGCLQLLLVVQEHVIVLKYKSFIHFYRPAP